MNIFLLITYGALTTVYIYFSIKKKRLTDFMCAILWGICLIMQAINIITSFI